MKVAFIIPSLANKGPVLVCKDIVKTISHNVECIVYYFDAVIEVEFPCRCQQISFFSRINFNQFDIVHTHMFRPDMFIYIRRLFGMKGFKSITTIHTAIYDDLNFAYSKMKAVILPPLWEASWNSFDKVVVLTKFAKEYYRHLRSPMEVVYNGRATSNLGIDDCDSTVFSEIKNKYKILGTVASFDARKGLDQVVRALPQLKEFVFLIVGSGQEKIKNDLITLAEKLGVIERLYFLGKRSNGDRYIPYFDFFIIPSISEGFPLALLEATAQGKSVICSDIPVFTEVFTTDEVSFFKLFDVDSLVTAVNYAVDNDNMFRHNAHKRYMEFYTPQKMGENYLEIYGELINA